MRFHVVMADPHLNIQKNLLPEYSELVVFTIRATSLATSLLLFLQLYASVLFIGLEVKPEIVDVIESLINSTIFCLCILKRTCYDKGCILISPILRRNSYESNKLSDENMQNFIFNY